MQTARLQLSVRQAAYNPTFWIVPFFNEIAVVVWLQNCAAIPFFLQLFLYICSENYNRKI